MARFRSLTLLPLTALGLLGISFFSSPTYAGAEEPGEKGANVYCFMRSSGNNHSVSWDAAYQIVKRQKSSLFKTSPKHAAVMITETVVNNPEKYSDCGNYIGDMYANDLIKEGLPKENFETKEKEIPSKVKKGDRYSY